MGALIAKNLVNWQSLQERLDLFAVYRLIHLHEQNKGPPPTLSYEEQYIKVHRSIEEQLEYYLGVLHKQLQQNVDQFCQEPFSLVIEKSSIPHPAAGNGVFLRGSAVPGSFIGFHPGLVIRVDSNMKIQFKENGQTTDINMDLFEIKYLAKDVRKMLNYPNISKDNCYLMSRYDGCILDAKDFNTDIQLPCGKRLNNPLACGHMINHPPPGSEPNVIPFNYDVRKTFPSDLVYLVPNRYYSEPGILFKTATVMRTIIFLATRHLNNEELFVNYRLNPSSKLPDWYTPVNLIEDKRRWSAD